MLVLKKLFSGNYLKKLHLIKSNSINNIKESDFIEKEQNIIDKKEEECKNEIVIDEGKNNDKKFYFISIYESSLDITLCEYDSIIKQYIQTPVLHQNFFFIIFDSEIIDSKIVLLTSIGLFIYKFEESKLELLFNEIFNIKCEPKDLLMYLKINIKLSIIAVYSNTNLFFLYYYDIKSNTCHKVNQINKLCNGYINNINIFDLEDINDYFILSAQIKKGNHFSADNYVYCFNKEKLEINEIEEKQLKDDNNSELKIKQNIKYINSIYDKLYEGENTNVEKKKEIKEINEIRYSLYGKYIFIINKNGFIILKNKKEEKDGKEENNIDLLISYKYKYGQNIKSSCFIDYQQIKNFHFLFFDNKITIFEEKNEILSRIKLTPKENKKLLTNKNAIFQDITPNNEISLILYNYKNDISFININKEEGSEENINKYKINIITKITNESMFCLDGVVTNNSKNEYKIVAICGLQGESRLIKYSNIFNEVNLFNQQINSEIVSICFPLYIFKQNYFSNIFITSSNFKSTLYSLSKTFQINHLINFESPALKIYPILNNEKNSYIIVLKYGVGIITFNDNIDMHQYTMNNLYECQKNEENNNYIVHILFSYHFLFKGLDYLVIYLTNRLILCFNISSSNLIFKDEWNEIPQPSSLAVIAIERLNKLGFIFGNYTNNFITIIYYDFEQNRFETEKKTETKLIDSSGYALLTPDDILIYKYYIFITTHTGDFIVLYFNDNNLENPINAIFNLENIPRNKMSLKFSQIDYAEEKNEFNVDFYSLKNAYNISLKINNGANNEIICNNNNQLTKYKFYKMIESPLLLFQKIYSENNKIKVHFYFSKNRLNFSYFEENINKNDLSIETIYNFPNNEKAVKIISITERNGEILILSNNLNLYLFNEDLNLVLQKNISDDIKKKDLKINGMKNYIIKEDDEGDKADINIIILFGGFKTEDNKTIGILLIYEINDINLNLIKIISGYPQIIIDACFIKKYIICGIEAALCVREYNIKNKQFVWSQEAKSIMISNFMNKITNLVPLNNFCNSYYLLTSDIYESFQLIKFSSVSLEKYETIGADLSLNNLGNIYPINNIKEEVFTTDKKGIITRFKLNDEIYQINNRVDLKEYITKMYISDDKIIMIGILGSIYFGEIFDKYNIKNNKEYELALLEFQKNVLKEVSFINLKKNIDYEEAMLMNEKINNVLLIDILLNFCEIYFDELNKKIKDFQNMFKNLKFITDDLIFKSE